MLIDTGSTHNFISLSLVKNLGLVLSPCETLKVTLGDGSTTGCNHKVAQLKWYMAGHEYSSNFHAIPLGGYDAILSVQWLQEVSPVSFDFNKQEIVIQKGRERVTMIQTTPQRTRFSIDLEGEHVKDVGT